MTTEQPAANAGAIFLVIIAAGKFHLIIGLAEYRGNNCRNYRAQDEVEINLRSYNTANSNRLFNCHYCRIGHRAGYCVAIRTRCLLCKPRNKACCVDNLSFCLSIRFTVFQT